MDAAPFPNLFDDGWTISIFGPDIAFIISSFPGATNQSTEARNWSGCWLVLEFLLF
jgi:hypothetical protein